MTKFILGKFGLASAALLLISGCTRDWKSQPISMWNESRYKPYEATTFFPDNSTSRPTVRGSVARGQLRTDEAFFNGTQNGTLVTQFPFKLTAETLQRGKQRYEIYCAPCHGEGGAGNGMIIQRGFSKPPDYVEQRLVDAPVGHFYDVITNGYGSMYSYAARIPPRDRWAIAAYIRVLQRHRGATVADVPADKKTELNTPFKSRLDDTPTGTAIGGGAVESGASNKRTSESLDDPSRSSPTRAGENSGRLGSPAGQSANGGVPVPEAAGTPETTTLPSVRSDALKPGNNPVAGAGENATRGNTDQDLANPSERE